MKIHWCSMILSWDPGQWQRHNKLECPTSDSTRKWVATKCTIRAINGYMGSTIILTHTYRFNLIKIWICLVIIHSALRTLIFKLFSSEKCLTATWSRDNSLPASNSEIATKPCQLVLWVYESRRLRTPICRIQLALQMTSDKIWIQDLNSKICTLVFRTRLLIISIKLDNLHLVRRREERERLGLIEVWIRKFVESLEAQALWT